MLKVMPILVVSAVVWTHGGCKSRPDAAVKSDPATGVLFYNVTIEDYEDDASKTVFKTYSSDDRSTLKNADRARRGLPCWAMTSLIKMDPTIEDVFGKLLKNNDVEAGKTILRGLIQGACAQDPMKLIGTVSEKTNAVDQEAMQAIAERMNTILFKESLSATFGVCLMEVTCAESGQFCKDHVAQSNCIEGQDSEKTIEIFGVVPRCSYVLRRYAGISCAMLGNESYESNP